MGNPWTDPFKQKRMEPAAAEEQADKKRAEDWKGTLGRIGRYLLKSRGKLSVVVLMIAVSSLMALAGPLIVGLSVDEFLVDGDLGMIGFVLAALAAVYLLHSLSVFLQHFWMIQVSQRTVYDIRTSLFDQLQQLPVAFFDKRRHGELMSRITNDVDNISNTLNSSIIQIVQSVLTLGGILIVMLYLSPLLTFITLTIVPAMVFGMKWITKRTAPLFKAQQKRLGEMTGYVQETMSGQRIIKSFSQEERVIRSFEERNAALFQAAFWAQTISGFIPKLMNMLNNVSFAVIAGFGGLLALNGMITIGVIVIFAEYARQFTRPLNDLANQVNVLLSAIAGAERVFSIIDEESERREGEEVRRLPGASIAFDHVTFAYEEETILHDVTFQAEEGQTVALVGPTGAGKTTTISLLARFYDPQEGTIRIGGSDIRSIDKEALRGQMAFVLQDSFLFEGTIRENIRYGRLNASDDAVLQAAADANADGFIRRLPDDYDTRIDAEGGGISQGQRQLLAIARALLADTDILILDEATSSIDTITELKIQEALQRLMKGRTSIVIAHRLNTIQAADQIIVMEQGGIVEKGSHVELMTEDGRYADLVKSQHESGSPATLSS
ncbi:ABC transporter transmembrane domain-containing protein [Alkalicoccus chagannorensis]